MKFLPLIRGPLREGISIGLDGDGHHHFLLENGAIAYGLDYAEGYTAFADVGEFDTWVKDETLWVGCKKFDINRLPTEETTGLLLHNYGLDNSFIEDLVEQLRLYKTWGIIPYKKRMIDKEVLMTIYSTKRGYSITQNKKVVAHISSLHKFPIDLGNLWSWKGKGSVSGKWEKQ